MQERPGTPSASPWPRAQRTSLDGDITVLTAGWGPGPSGADPVGGPSPKAQHRELQSGAPGVSHCFGVHTRSPHTVSGFWKVVHSPDPDGVEGGSSVLCSDVRAPVPPPTHHAHPHPKGGAPGGS